mgnify:CR=1 FL=1
MDAGNTSPHDKENTKTRKAALQGLRVFGVCLMRAIPVLLVAVLLILGALWWRLSTGPLPLPEIARVRLETILDQSVPTARVRLGDASIALPDGIAPEIMLTDVVLRHPDGDVRAAFPEVRVALAMSSLLQGALRLTGIEIAGAGLRLSRDANGAFDLRFTQGDEGAPLGLSETLARIDTIFTAPAFSDLALVVGRDLNITLVDAATGRVMQIQNAHMRLDRKNDDLTLSMGGALERNPEAIDLEPTIDLAITRTAGAVHTDMGLTFADLSARDVATFAPVLSWLDLINAPISGRLVARLGDDGGIGDLSGALHIGTGNVLFEGINAPLPFDRLEIAVEYDAATQRMAFTLFELDAPELRFSAQGYADASADGNTFTGQFQVSGIEADPRHLFVSPLILDGAVVDMRLILSPHLTLEIGQATLHDGSLQARASGRVQARDNGLDVRLDVTVATLEAEQALSYWPLAAAPRLRAWISENLYSATLHGVDFALRMGPDAPLRHALQFDFTNTQVRAIRTLPPIQNAMGYLNLNGSRLIVRVDEGTISPPPTDTETETTQAHVTIANGTMMVEDVRIRGPDAQFNFDVRGDVGDVLRLLAEPPVALFARGNLTPDDIGTGQADIAVQLNAPLRRGTQLSDVNFTAEGGVTSYQSRNLVPNRTLAAQRLTLSASDRGVTVQGQVNLDGVPATGQWSRALGTENRTSRIEARVTLTPDDFSRLGIILPDGMVSGRMQADVAVDFAPQQPPVLSLQSDLVGMGVSLPPLGWRLRPDQSGDLTLQADLGPAPSVPQIELRGGGLTLTGSVDLNPGGGFAQLTADSLQVGQWLDVSGALISRGSGQAPRIEVSSGVLDVRRAPRIQQSSAGLGGPIDVTLNRLQVTEGIALTGLRADLTSDGGLSGPFNAQVNGAAAVTGTLVVTGNGPSVRIVADDAGAALRAAGLFDGVFGGNMELRLNATGAAGTYDGQFTMRNEPRLRGAPAVAELLNLISVVGLLEQLSQEGINLGGVDARFRITPDRIVLSQGTAVGPSMGLSMDGIYYTAARQFDMQGVISPLYLINGAMGAFVAARREGVFGFTYRLRGAPENIDVSVNPLSIMVPGIFRDIFRRPSPDLSAAE